MVSKARATGPNQQQRKTTKPLATSIRARRSSHPQSGNTRRTDPPESLPDVDYNSFLHDIVERTGKEKLVRRQLWNSVIEFVLDLEDDPTTQVRVFPRYAMLFLMALTCYSRYLMINGFEAHGMIHPDETFQAIEVAHARVYGYGFDPYGNFSDSYSDDISRPPQPWLYTNVYVLLFHVRNIFGWQDAPFVVARKFHAAVSATLPLSIYKFTRTIFGQCRDIAFVAATLVAFSKPIMLFGIHPFLQSLLSPIIFLMLTLVLRIVAAIPSTMCTTTSRVSKSIMGQPNTAHSRTKLESVAPDDFVQSESLGIFVCGLILGLLILLQVDSCVLISICVLVFSSRRSSLKSQVLLRATAAAAIWLGSGAALGFTFGATGDFINSGQWLETPLNTIAFLRQNSSSNVSYFRIFLGASHVNGVLLGAALMVSIIYLTHIYGLLDLFDGWIGGNAPELPLFCSTLKVLIVVTALNLFYSCLNHRQTHFAHDVIVLTLITGAASIYLLYRGLYTYIVRIATPKRVTRNFVKLILYAELFLYMFESRVTFPTSQNGGITEWAYKSLGESAYINRCLMYVGGQTDVTGILVDYSVHMIGGFSLMHHDIPIYAKNGLEFREWGLQRRKNVTLHASIHNFLKRFRSTAQEGGQSHIRLATLNEVTDLVSLFNLPLLTKRLCETASYNYVIISGGRRFFRKGFREVFNASDARVFKRSKSRTERDYLLEAVSKIPNGVNATILQYEGYRLVQLNVYKKAIERLQQAVQLDATKLLTWQLLIFTLEQMKLWDEAKQTLSHCHQVHGSTCSQPINIYDNDLQMSLRGEWKGLLEMKEKNITYKFSLPNF